MFFRTSISLAFFLVLLTSAFSKTIELFDLKSNINVIYASDYSYEPGDTFCLEGGVVSGGLRLFNFVGEEGNPLVFINCGGRVEIEDPTYTGIDFRNCHHIHLTGRGSESDEYGIYVRFGM